jgi:hypothetical protein
VLWAAVVGIAFAIAVGLWLARRLKMVEAQHTASTVAPALSQTS